MFQVIDDILPQEEFEDIKNNILNVDFPWKLSTSVAKEGEKLPIQASYYFTHVFWDNFYTEPQSQLFTPLFFFFYCHALMRIKANCYPSTSEIILHDNHLDYDFSHKGAIFYLNTNNGCTILEDEHEIQSVENRLLLFDPSKPHRSTTCTDDKCRVNVNFNFF